MEMTYQKSWDVRNRFLGIEWSEDERGNRIGDRIYFALCPKVQFSHHLHS
jgi:hypothetical protein